MQFKCHNQSFILHGMLAGAVHVASKRQAARLGNFMKGTCILLMATFDIEGSTIYKGKPFLPADLQQLLYQYSKLLNLIYLVDESQPVKLRPYMYLSIQKDEIERMIKKMKATRIIRDNTSSFALTVVLVKKKDRSWRLCIDYKQFNKLTVKDKFPIPLVDELLDELSGAFFFQTGFAIWLSPDQNG